MVESLPVLGYSSVMLNFGLTSLVDGLCECQESNTIQCLEKRLQGGRRNQMCSCVHISMQKPTGCYSPLGRIEGSEY